MRAEDLAEELAIAEERLREDTHVVTRVFQQALSAVTTWPPAVTVRSETTVAEAMRIMVEAQVGVGAHRRSRPSGGDFYGTRCLDQGRNTSHGCRADAGERLHDPGAAGLEVG